MYKEKELEKILPHKFPMILINRVIVCNVQNKTLISETDITKNSLFFDEKLNAVPIWVGVEYMAQTVGALAGIHAVATEGAVKMGFVIGARNYECFAPNFELGKCLTTKVEQLFFDSQLGAFNCEIFDGDKKLAQAQLNVFQPSSIKDFFENYA